MLLQDPMKEVPPSIVPFTDRFRLAVRARLIQLGITPYRFCTDTLLCTEWHLNRILDGTRIPSLELASDIMIRLGMDFRFILASPTDVKPFSVAKRGRPRKVP